MECFNSFFDINIKVPTAITIGKFDGIHKGHHALTSELISKKSLGLSSCVITFQRSPRFLLSKDATPPLFTNEERKYIFEKNGINYLIISEFNKEFMELDATKFIEILCKNLNMKFLVVGDDFTFGYKGNGNVPFLKKASEKYGFELKIINKIKKDNKDISSSSIRDELLKGNIELVNEMLGYEYFILGLALRENCSKNNRIPPIYIIPPKEKLLPKFGVYFTKILFEGKIYNGTTKIGNNLITNKSNKHWKNDLQIEIYIQKLNVDLNGKNIQINFINRFKDINNTFYLINQEGKKEKLGI